MAVVQSHIHIDTVLGGAPENAPTLKWSSVKERMLIYETYAEFDRAWDGTPQFSSMADDLGGPSIFQNMRYTLRVSQEELEVLEGLLLKPVYLVDNIHPANGADHTSYVRNMLFIDLKYKDHVGPTLQTHEVEITLVVNTA